MRLPVQPTDPRTANGANAALPEGPPGLSISFHFASVGDAGLVAHRPTFLYTAVAAGRTSERFTSDVEYRVDDELPLSSARWHVERVELAGDALFGGVRYDWRRLYCSTD